MEGDRNGLPLFFIKEEIMLEAVIGAGFGDEGKGHVVEQLVGIRPYPRSGSLVVRFSGGQQAGHTVVNSSGQAHTFSNFGSGTLHGTRTFWSNFCTFDPLGCMCEYAVLVDKFNITPELIVDSMAMVTTPYDVYYNRQQCAGTYNSCGVGVGTTMQRNLQTMYKLYAQDMLHQHILERRIAGLRTYYKQLLKPEYMVIADAEISKFYAAVEACRKRITIKNEIGTLNLYDHIVFEGSQGILLDQDFGFAPYVTWGNTTSKNIFTILQRNNIEKPLEIYYVSRVYSTRHGDGPIISQHGIELKEENVQEHNVLNKYQGAFKTRTLDIDLLSHAIACDSNFTFGDSYNLVFTCLDHLEKIPYIKDGILKTASDINELWDILPKNYRARKCFYTNAPNGALLSL